MALTGINYPWLNYGWDFGDPPQGWSGGQETDAFRAAQRQTIKADFLTIAGSGMSVVRWFLLADGLSYGTGSQRPTLDGKFHPLPPGDPWIRQFAEDFGHLLDLCIECKVKLLPSFLDFHFAYAPVTEGDQVVKGGRYAVFENDSTRRLFLDTLFDPLLEVSQKKRDAIYAWEVMNEPEWCTGDEEWKFWQKPYSKDHNVSRGDMRAFLKEGVRRVNEAGFTSTVGFANWNTIKDWGAEDWDIGLQQFHYYVQEKADLPAARDVTSQPCLLGEYSTNPAKPWPGGVETLAAKMKRAEERGYEGQLLWSYRAGDQVTVWNEAQLLAVADHNGHRSMGAA